MEAVNEEQLSCLFNLGRRKYTFYLCMQSKRTAVVRMMPSSRKE